MFCELKLTNKVRCKDKVDQIMTFEKQFCTRCTNAHFCIKIGKKWYCQACFEEVVNDPETSKQMEQIMIQCGIEDLE